MQYAKRNENIFRLVGNLVDLRCSRCFRYNGIEESFFLSREEVSVTDYSLIIYYVIKTRVIRTRSALLDVEIVD